VDTIQLYGHNRRGKEEQDDGQNAASFPIAFDAHVAISPLGYNKI